ncbi:MULTISPECIES: carbohydrate ABC transporter permease [Paenibacillus]|uniref:carbohydrate ABC transporter permease n=1 Tax=Paenibacillus TaxID=44249 RepID=UPI0004027C7E|nr:MULTISPECIES: sugar ABC transporter permease [Paenibacillus]OZQ71307.1 sugar ABC transporter permease [Paenibacillus taichungensis]HBU83782.1 sugar ABC transporter permease [Paenibacillus sp.]
MTGKHEGIKSFRGIRMLRKEWMAAVLFLAPSLIGFSVFYLIPFAAGLLYSFQDNTIDGTFVGLDNYQAVLSSGSFRNAAANTLLFTGVSVPLIIALSLCFAHLLNRRLFIRNWLQTAFVLPLVVPVASIVMMWQILFDWNGTLNVWLQHLHMGRVDWMKSGWSMVVLVVVYVWKNIGYNIILFLAGLQSIPKDYYETADIEGANGLHKWLHITWVYLTPTMFIVVLMSIINSFKVFRETYLIAGDYPYDRIYMLQHYMNNMFMSLDVQKLTAAAALMVASILLFVSFMLMIERRFRSFME